MNVAILQLTVRQLLGQRRTLLMLFFAALPVGIAILYRVSGSSTDETRWTARALESGLIVATFLPLCALVFGTAALGTEFEDGTAAYLLSKPVPRWHVVLSKLLVAWLATAALTLLAAILGGVIAIGNPGSQGVLLGFGVAIIVGSLVYCCLFVMLSILTSRALIVGLLYVFIWEGLITGLFTGTRLMSVRHYTLGIAKALTTTSRQTFDAKLSGPESLILMAVVGVAATLVAIRALERWEIGESA